MKTTCTYGLLIPKLVFTKLKEHSFIWKFLQELGLTRKSVSANNCKLNQHSFYTLWINFAHKSNVT